MNTSMLLPRGRITGALEEALAFPLVTLTAPAGYGKTLSLRALMACRKTPAYYFAVSEGTDSARYLWNELCGRLHAQGAPLASLFGKLGFPEDAVAVDRILRELRRPGKEHVLLILDDYHLAAAPAFDGFLDRLIRAHLPGFTLLLSSRVEPELCLEDLRVKGLAQAFGQNFLAFSEAETRAYFTLHGIADNTAASSAWADCAGCPAALWLRARQYTARGSAPSVRETDKLLENLVFAQCGPAEQRLLLQLSLLDSFTPEEAARVADDPAAPRRLERLREKNALIQDDPQSGSYRLHGLLRAFLAKRLKAEAAAYGIDRQLQSRRLGEILLDRGDVLKAARFFFLAGRDEDLLRLLDLFALPRGKRLLYFAAAKIASMILAVPWPLRLARPLEYLAFIDAYLAECGPTAALPLLEEAEQRFREDQSLAPVLKRRLAGESLLIRGLLAFNDLATMRAIHREAHALLNGRSRLRTRRFIWNFACPHASYLYLREPGSYRDSVERIESDLRYYQDLADGCSAGAQTLFRAEYTLETDDSPKARSTVEALLDICELRANAREQAAVKLMAAFCRARLRLAQGRADEAAALLEAEKPIVGGIGHTDLDTCLDLALGYVYACQGHAGSIPAWLREASYAPTRTVPQIRGFIETVRGKAALAAGEYARLETLASNLPESLIPFDNLFGYIHAKTQQAIATYRLRGADKALPLLREALSLARPDGIWLSIAEYGEPILPLLSKLRERAPGDADLTRLVRLTEPYLRVPIRNGVKRRGQICLTPRQETMLRLVSQGLRNAAIAETLNLSSETVKKTLSAAYQRLGASNRAEAVCRFLEHA